MKLIKSENLWQRFRVTCGIERRPPLRLIHIGKCGGRTLVRAIEDSPRIERDFRSFMRTHVRQPIYLESEVYLFVVRNPIARAISAFNWRYRLVVHEGRVSHTHVNEKEILLKYNSMDALATALYANNQLDTVVATEFKSIGHLKEGICEYIGNVSSLITKDQIFSVFCQETLNEDIERDLLVPTDGRIRQHENRGQSDSAELSPIARKNLARFLTPEYDAIKDLLSLYPLDDERTNALLTT